MAASLSPRFSAARACSMSAVWAANEAPADTTTIASARRIPWAAALIGFSFVLSGAGSSDFLAWWRRLGCRPLAPHATPMAPMLPVPAGAHPSLDMSLEEDLRQQDQSPRLPEADRFDTEDVDECHTPEP